MRAHREFYMSLHALNFMSAQNLTVPTDMCIIYIYIHTHIHAHVHNRKLLILDDIWTHVCDLRRERERDRESENQTNTGANPNPSRPLTP